MRSLRKRIELKDGVEVETLFTPHLFSFKGFAGTTFEVDPERPVSSAEVFADIAYCAALNAWVLDGKGTQEEFPYTRGDFHEWMAAEPREFGRMVSFATEALTGKTVAEAAKAEEPAAEEGKKKHLTLIGRRSKRSS